MKKISVVIHMLKLWEAGNEVIYAKRKVRKRYFFNNNIFYGFSIFYIILLLKEQYHLNWQTPLEVINYIKENYNKLNSIYIFDVYSK